MGTGTRVGGVMGFRVAGLGLVVGGLLVGGAAFPAEGLAQLPSPAPAPAVAEPPPRGGGWVDLGAGAGWGQLTCDICRDQRASGVDLRFGVGTMIRPGVGLGVETSGWVTSTDPARQIIGSVHVVARLYPGAGPFRVQAGVGTGHYRGLESGDADDLSLTALSALLGVSGEARLGSRFRLEPTLSATFGAFGTLNRGDREVWDRAGFNLLRLGVAVSRRGGSGAG